MFRVNTYNGGDTMANALIYKPPPPNVMNYLQNNLQHVLDSSNEVGSRFVETVKEMYNSVHSDQARNQAKMMLYAAGQHLNQDVIVPVPFSNLHMANQCMQNYIMAQPTIGNLYKRDMCYGYEDTRVPIEIDTYGKDTLAYGQVMDGVLQFEEDTGEGFIEYYSQDDEILGGELHIIDQMSVLETWSNVARMLEEGFDPTDPTLEEM